MMLTRPYLRADAGVANPVVLRDELIEEEIDFGSEALAIGRSQQAQFGKATRELAPRAGWSQTRIPGILNRRQNRFIVTIGQPRVNQPIFSSHVVF